MKIRYKITLLLASTNILTLLPTRDLFGGAIQGLLIFFTNSGVLLYELFLLALSNTNINISFKNIFYKSYSTTIFGFLIWALMAYTSGLIYEKNLNNKRYIKNLILTAPFLLSFLLSFTAIILVIIFSHAPTYGSG